MRLPFVRTWTSAMTCRRRSVAFPSEHQLAAHRGSEVPAVLTELALLALLAKVYGLPSPFGGGIEMRCDLKHVLICDRPRLAPC